MIQHIFAIHEEDEFVGEYGKELIRCVRERGAVYAIDRIKTKIMPDLCTKCNDTSQPMVSK